MSIRLSVRPSGVIFKWRKTLRPVFRWRRNFIWPKRKSKTFQKRHQNVENTTVTMDIMISILYSLHMTFLIANTLLLNSLNFEHRQQKSRKCVRLSVGPSVDLFVHPMLFLSDKNWGFWEWKVWNDIINDKLVASCEPRGSCFPFISHDSSFLAFAFAVNFSFSWRIKSERKKGNNSFLSRGFPGERCLCSDSIMNDYALFSSISSHSFLLSRFSCFSFVPLWFRTAWFPSI